MAKSKSRSVSVPSVVPSVTVTDDAPIVTVPAAIPAVTVPAAIPADVLPTPHGFDAIRAAVMATGINANVAMTVDAIRADIAAVAAAIDAAVPGVPVPPKNRGRYTGMRTYDFQNTLFHVNDRAGWRFTDRTLAIMWAVELTANRCDFAAHAGYIGSTRTAYVNGRHGSNVVNPTVHVSAVHPVTAHAGTTA